MPRDRLPARRPHRDRVQAARQREPALVETLRAEPEAAVECDGGAVGDVAEQHEAVAA